MLEKVAEIISNTNAILICAGAGMGVDSGLPDFRGNQGFWKAYPPYAEKGLSFVDMANPSWFHSDPEFAWGFYGHRLELYRNTPPHKGFDILLNWAKSKSKGYFVFTSNVDGHFQKAGFPDQNIIEIHGSIHHLQCLKSCSQNIFSAQEYNISIDETTMRAQNPLPTCPSCHSIARPNILMFGDWSWDTSRQESQMHNYQNWLSGIEKNKLTIIECGAGTGVPTVRYESERIAKHYSGMVIRINVRESQISSPHISISRGALDTIIDIDQLIIRN